VATTSTGMSGVWPGQPGKSSFPRDWTADDVIAASLAVADDPTATRELREGGRVKVTGHHRGVTLRVILGADGAIVTGYPVRVRRRG